MFMATNTSNNRLFWSISIQGGVFNCFIYSDLALSNNEICRLGFNLEPRTDSLCI